MTVDAIRPDALSEADEARRAIAMDFQEVFSTPEGERVLQHLLGSILYTDKTLPRPSPGIAFSGDDALYMLARNDAAKEIRAILNIEFRDSPKPVVRRGKGPISRFTSHS
jgi:hypothetical protein